MLADALGIGERRHRRSESGTEERDDRYGPTAVAHRRGTVPAAHAQVKLPRPYLIRLAMYWAVRLAKAMTDSWGGTATAVGNTLASAT